MRKSIILLLIITLSCQVKEENTEPLEPMSFAEVAFPGSNAAEPNLTKGPDGKIYLNWLNDDYL